MVRTLEGRVAPAFQPPSCFPMRYALKYTFTQVNPQNSLQFPLLFALPDFELAKSRDPILNLRDAGSTPLVWSRVNRQRHQTILPRFNRVVGKRRRGWWPEAVVSCSCHV